MSYYVSISTLDGSAKWEAAMDMNQKAVIEGLVQGDQKDNQTLAPYIPTRTNNLKNLVEDLFLPTTRYFQALSANNIIVRILAATLSIFWDLFTLPIRVLTCIPRMIVNATQKKHPLHRHLANLNVDSKILNSDVVDVCITSVICRPSANQRGGELLVDYHIDQLVRKQVAFIEVPFLDNHPAFSFQPGNNIPVSFFHGLIRDLTTNPAILAQFIPRPAAA